MRFLKISLIGLAIFAIPSRAMAWELGETGLHLQKTPFNLLVTGLDPASPASDSGLPFSTQDVEILAYVNGKPALAMWGEGEWDQALASNSIRLTLRVRAPGDLESHLIGPFNVALMPNPDLALQNDVRARRWQAAAALVRGGEVSAAMATSFWARVSMTAQFYARADNWDQAMSLAKLVPSDDPAAKSLEASLPDWQAKAAHEDSEAQRFMARDDERSLRDFGHRSCWPRLASMKKRPG